MDTRHSSVPAPAPHELRRERLLELLHKHRARPLVLLVAPVGFGKSTLAATYGRDSGAAVAWLTLHAADRDARRLFERLADAFEAGFDEPGTMAELRKGLDEGADGIGLARLLLADLGQAPAGFILVLDDFNAIGEADDVVSAVDALIRDLPEAGQIVITAREAPALSMTRLVVDNAVYALSAEDLRFSPDETRMLRALRGGDADADARDQQAEGWVAGILLGGAPRTLGVGGGSLLGSYVEREVLARLTPEEQGWLEMLSVFETITPRIAARVLGAGAWPSRLLALAERCPFLTARQDGSYRLHGLVREAVYNRLTRSPDDRATQAWTVARDIAAETLDTVALVRACQELGQVEGAVELVRRSCAETVQTGRWAALLVTLELLPEPTRRGYADLGLIEARALSNSGHPERARKAAEQILELGGRTDDVVVQLSAIIELATISYPNDLTAAIDYLSAVDHLLRHTQISTGRHRLLEGRALGIKGICATLRGDIVAAREAFETGERLLKLLGPSRDLALVQQNFGSFCNRTGDYATAQLALSSAASHWRLMGDRNGLAATQTILGDMHLRLGNLEAAGAELNDALAAARSVGALRLEAWATTSLGQWHRANGRILDAVTAFDEGVRLAEEIVERELLAETLVWRAEVALLQDDLPSALKLLAHAQTEGQRVGSSSALASVDRALGRLHLVDGAAARAISHFEQALEHGGNAWGPDQRAETLYWLGTAYLNLNRVQQATGFLESAIELALEANLPALLAGPAAEDPALLLAGRKLGLSPVLLADVERVAATRRPWTGVRPRELVSVVAENNLPRLEVQMFGSFVLHRDGQLINKASRKVDRARELMAVLILHPKGLSDETIAEMMFPDMPRESAQHNLQMAAYSLRKDLGSKAAVRYSAHSYQLNPQFELIADVLEFEQALARARGAANDALIQSLSRALAVYRGPLMADAAWGWLEPVRQEFQDRFVRAALQLADVLSSVDPARSDTLAEEALAVAPDTDLAYERLILNARLRRDRDSLRRLVKRYTQAAAQHGFHVNAHLIDDQDGTGGLRPAR